MNQSLRKTVIAGNWKMNLDRRQAQQLLEQLKPLVEQASCEVVVCVPYTNLEIVAQQLNGSHMKLGAQNCHFKESGAYTGEISASMLVEMGVSHVIIGHSERREYFAETNQTVNQRVKAALQAGLSVILCVGETLEDREHGITDELVTMQTKIALNGVSLSQLENVIIAYEPVWAIGTGKTATAQQANEVCAMIRRVVGGLYGDHASQTLTIQYGGSMNAQNAAELLAQSDIDGGLIGGASLKADDFSVIVGATTVKNT